MRNTTSRLSRWTVALACVLALSACSQTPEGPTRESSATPTETPTQSPASPAESLEKYDSLRTELAAALEQKLPGITWSTDTGVTMAKSNDGRCILQPASMKSSADIVEASRNFEDVFAAGDPVLSEHGFPAFGGTDDVPGGWLVARSTDAAGATASIEAKGTAYLRITVPVNSASCSPTEILKD